MRHNERHKFHCETGRSSRRRSRPRIPDNVSGSELNVAVQLDGDYAQHNYSIWMDRVALNYW